MHLHPGDQPGFARVRDRHDHVPGPVGRRCQHQWQDPTDRPHRPVQAQLADMDDLLDGALW